MRKRTLCAQMMTLCLLLSACNGGAEMGGNKAEELALTIRGEYLAMSSCSGSVDVTADYGERVYEYTLNLNWQKESGYTLVVAEPEDIAGVTITVTEGQTALEYDGARIETGAITPEGLSPVDAIPTFFEYAREGFIAACVEETLEEQQTLRVVFREPEATPGTGTEASLWFGLTGHGLLRGELSVDGVTVIQCVFYEVQMA